MAAKKKSFEESLARLGEVVRTLERGDAPLADSLKLFEEGAAGVWNAVSTSSLMSMATSLPSAT